MKTFLILGMLLLPSLTVSAAPRELDRDNPYGYFQLHSPPDKVEYMRARRMIAEACQNIQLKLDHGRHNLSDEDLAVLQAEMHQCNPGSIEVEMFRACFEEDVEPEYCPITELLLMNGALLQVAAEG